MGKIKVADLFSQKLSDVGSVAMLTPCISYTNAFVYTVSQKNDTKNDTDVTHYRFNPHQPISVIFGRDVAERVCY